MTLKITDFIPPIFNKLIHKILFINKNNLNTTQEYETFQEADEKCLNNNYKNLELCNLVASKTLNFRDSLIKKPNTLSTKNSFLLNAINHIRATKKLNTINILDIGGACGAHYFEIRNFIPETCKINWLVIETSEMVDAAKAHHLETNELSFSSELVNLPNIDFIHSSGALQYISNPYEYIDYLLKLEAPFIFFNRMIFNTNENEKDIITIQTSKLVDHGPTQNVKKTSEKIMYTPHITLSFSKFQKKLQKNYDLHWSFNEDFGIMQMNNQPLYGCGLFYSRTSETNPL